MLTRQEKPAVDAEQLGGPQFCAALRFIDQIVRDELRHGYFTYTISSEIGKGSRRELVIEAGKSHKYAIPVDELPR